MQYRLGRYRGAFAAIWRDGGTKRRSLGTRDKVEAQRLFEVFLAEAERKARAQDPTAGEIMDAYAADLKARGKSADRVERAKKALGPLVEKRPTTITVEDCRGHAKGRREAGTSNGTIWTELGHLRSALQWAVKRRWLRRDDEPHIELPPKPKGRQRWLTKDEAARLVDACRSPHVRLFIIVALGTGARAEAILELKWKQVDFEAKAVDFNPEVRRLGIKARARARMGPKLLAALSVAKDAALSDYVIEYAGGQVASVKKGIALAARRAGIEGVSAHVFRHTAATWMRQARVPWREIADQLGHEDEETTKRTYAHADPDFQKDAAAALEW